MNREQLIARILLTLEEIEPWNSKGERARERERLDSMSDGELQDRFNEVVSAGLEVQQ